MADPTLASTLMPMMGAPAGPDMDDASAPREEIIERDLPTADQSRAASVTKWQDRVTRAREYWEKEAFEGMRKNMRLARGDQWSDAATPPSKTASGFTVPDLLNDEPGARYVANVVLRHIHARTASIYGKNPKFVARRAKRLNSTVWDGTFQSVQQAIQTITTMMAAPGDPNAMAAAVQANAILTDAQQTIEQNKMLDKVAETLQLLFEHEISEQSVPFKVQMKGTVRRALTTGVGYVKIGYQRVMGLRPEAEAEMNDMSQKLATLERLAADVADGETFDGAPEIDQLKLLMKSVQQSGEMVVREGLAFTYPNSTAIIPDTAVQQLLVIDNTTAMICLSH